MSSFTKEVGPIICRDIEKLMHAALPSPMKLCDSGALNSVTNSQKCFDKACLVPRTRGFFYKVFVTIGDQYHYLWRAVDQDGDVLDIPMQKNRDKLAAKRFIRKLLKGLLYTPCRIFTEKLRSFGDARKEVLPDVILDNEK